MATTRAFKSGNSQAVRIPAEIAYEDISKDLTIKRHGDLLMIYPARSSMKDALERLRALPKPEQVEVYEPIQMPERDWD